LRVRCAVAMDVPAGGGRSDLDGVMTVVAVVCGKLAVKDLMGRR
jgi:hypothetical protein